MVEGDLRTLDHVEVDRIGVEPAPEGGPEGRQRTSQPSVRPALGARERLVTIWSALNDLRADNASTSPTSATNCGSFCSSTSRSETTSGGAAGSTDARCSSRRGHAFASA